MDMGSYIGRCAMGPRVLLEDPCPVRLPEILTGAHINLALPQVQLVSRSRLRRQEYSTEGLFFGALFFAPFCFSAGKKERKKRGDAYVERAGPQAPKGVLGCNTLKP